MDCPLSTDTKGNHVMITDIIIGEVKSDQNKMFIMWCIYVELCRNKKELVRHLGPMPNLQKLISELSESGFIIIVNDWIQISSVGRNLIEDVINDSKNPLMNEIIVKTTIFFRDMCRVFGKIDAVLLGKLAGRLSAVAIPLFFICAISLLISQFSITGGSLFAAITITYLFFLSGLDKSD